MVTDVEVIAQLRGQSDWRYAKHGAPRYPDDSDYRFADLRTGSGFVDMAIEQRDGERVRIVVPLPSSGAEQPWLYADPQTPGDWMEQFLLWVDEEILTGGLNDTRARAVVDGDSYVVVVTYGWRLRDAKQHNRLMRRLGNPTD